MVIGKDNTIYGVFRLNTFPFTGYGIMAKLSNDGTKFDLVGDTTASSLIDFPIGVTKFTIRYDTVTGKYLSIGNITVNETCSYQRNVLALVSSDNLYDWTIEEVLLVDRTVMNEYVSISQHAFQYVDWVFDGNDIIMAVREAQDDADCFHNNNYLTFYRIENYKELVG